MPDLLAIVSLDSVVLFFCLVLSAFFSASETAITSIGQLKTKHMIESITDKPTAHLRLWLEHPGHVLTTILVFNNTVNILASAMTTKIALNYSKDYAVGISTGIVTAVILVFGEVIPKSFAKANAERLASVALRVINFLYRFLYPLIWVLSEFAAFMIRALGGKDSSIRPTLTEEELEFLINESESKDFKKDFISGVFEFDETKVREIMTPRTDISGLERNTDFDEVLKQTIRTGHSRIPVFDENVDHIVGMVFAKDLLRLLAQRNGDTPKISDFMREAFFVPETKAIIDVFKDLKRTKNHMAIVIDEHGGTAGIVTMEDILEEIVGEIQDEFDVEEAKILEIDQNVFDVAGSVGVNEFVDYFELDETMIEDIDHESDTIAGFLTHMLNDLPKVGQSVKVGSLDIEVSEMGRLRIERLRVTRLRA